MNNAERNHLILAATKATFDPLFEQIQREAAALVANKIPPKFIELLQDEAALPFLQKFSNQYINIASTQPNDKNQLVYTIMTRPDFLKVLWSIPGYRGEGAKPIRAPGLICDFQTKDCRIEHDDLHALYIKTWSDLFTANSELSKLAHSYNSRKKFETDFPALAIYLPEAKTPAKLPMIQVDSVKQTLSDLGIPASAA
ncbi:hypothetical protein ACQE3E_06465 [Methylomonas sp. MED-D]|uniref:hypothetical protein n=1 Tax=Methylomonas sp. MED-D TaxID=3418768 RepID=UPI003D07E244